MSILELILEDNTIAGLALLFVLGWGIAKFFGYDVPTPQIPL